MRLVVTDRPVSEVPGEVVVALFRPKRRGLKLPFADRLHPEAARRIARVTDAMTWFETREMRAPRAILVSLGSEREDAGLGGANGSLKEAEICAREAHELRVLGGMIERACDAQAIKRVVLAGLPAGCDAADLFEGMLLRGHGSSVWRDDAPTTSLRQITICVAAGTRGQRKPELEARQVMVEATNWARTLGDLPANIGTPAEIARQVQARVKPLGLSCSRITTRRAEALGMGLFCAVDRGSANRGQILVLEHRPDELGEESPLLVLIGKGVTHDTGGYNIKTSMDLHELTHDKCGAMAVVGAMEGIARLGVAAHVVAVVPLTENCVDANAYKPGDILRAHDGTSVYVENTDAEGRLILADMLAWVRERDPALVVDVATLTGASHVALGEAYAALFSNDDGARALLMEASRRSDDPLWPMPIDGLHDRELGHHKAEIKNIGVQGGGACSAAAFLRHFVDYPWAHVDIAGKASTDYVREYYGQGATGFGCRLLIHVARGFARRHDGGS